MLFAQPLSPEAAGDAAAPSLSDCLKSIGHRMSAWMNTCADNWAAAALYEHLSRLSDEELRRRGLSRGTLARDICNACDRRTAQP
jgi:hypothetical protein